MVSVSRQNVFAVLSKHHRMTSLTTDTDHGSPVGQAVDPDPLPAVQHGAVAVTLVKLAPVAPTGQPLAIRAPGHAGQAVLVTVAHLSLVS